MKLLIVGAMLVALSGCSGCGGGGGGEAPQEFSTAVINFNFQPDAQSETRGIADVAKIRIKVLDGTKTIDTQTFDYVSSVTTSCALQVSVGQRSFIVDALKADGKVEFTGKSAATTVVVGQVANVNVVLQPPTSQVDVDVEIHEVTGPPSIEITDVPPYGSWGIPLKGKVSGVNYGEAKVMVWIKVRGSWWPKPYFNSLFTSIGKDGKWTCSVTTGGVDEEATVLRAYLVSKDYSDPNQPPLPDADPADMVWGLAEVTRTP